MTSFILRSVQDRPSSYPPIDRNCTFCRIIADKSEAFVVYEDDKCMAFLGELASCGIEDTPLRTIRGQTFILYAAVTAS